MKVPNPFQLLPVTLLTHSGGLVFNNDEILIQL